MTLMSVRPDSSAASAMSPSVDPIACGPPGQVQVTMCNPIFMIVLSGSAVPACGWGLENCRSCGAPSIAINLEVDGAQAVVEVLEIVKHVPAMLFEQFEPRSFGGRGDREVGHTCDGRTSSALEVN